MRACCVRLRAAGCSRDRLTIEECIVKHHAWLLHDHAADDNRFSKFASELMFKVSTHARGRS